MSSNKIQIKRSTSNAVVTGLANGELAFTMASNTLFIGLPDGTGVAPIGGVRYPGVLTANQALVANASSAIDKVIVANAVITYLTANGSLGVANKLLASNSSGGIYWADAPSSINVSAQYTWTNTQTFQNTITFSSTINGTANNALNLGGTAASGYQTTAGLSANVATLAANSATYLGGNTASDLRSYSDTKASSAYSNAMSDTLSRSGSYTGNNTFGGTNTVISSNIVVTGAISSNVLPSANITYNLGSTGLRYNQVFAANIETQYVNVGRDLSVSGNLYVTGTVAYVNTASFTTTDSLLQFASNNSVADVVDIGFFGEYNQSSTVKYTGLVRTASDGTYSLFTGLTDLPNSTVNTSSGSFVFATLKTYLNSSALVANSTQTNITANGSVSVAITANTLNFDAIDAGTF